MIQIYTISADAQIGRPLRADSKQCPSAVCSNPLFGVTSHSVIAQHYHSPDHRRHSVFHRITSSAR